MNWKRALLALVVLVALPYARGPMYRFPAPGVFTGSHFLNPYADLKGRWQRTNLHAHSRAWAGLTNGHQRDEEVIGAYRRLGYAVAGLSNYQRISTFDGADSPPIYEHGYSLWKYHQLAIGARHVDWFDFPLVQSLNQQQFIIDRLKSSADLVALNHPSHRDAYSADDLQQLTGYDLIEVVNGPFTVEDLWDAALSSGHPVWAIADDDSHDVSDPKRTGIAWNMVDAPSAATTDIIAALRAGRTYAVSRTAESPAGRDTVVTGLAVRDGALAIDWQGEPAMVRFVGQDGVVRGTVRAEGHAVYTLRPDDAYVRAVIQTPSLSIYMNPVLRYDGVALRPPTASVDVAGTWLFRGSVGAGAILILAGARAMRRRRTPNVAPQAQPVLPGANRNPA